MTTKTELFVLVLLHAATAMAAWRSWHRANDAANCKHALQLQVRALEQEVAARESMRVAERQGRVAAEKELRRVMDEKLDTSQGTYVQAIGVVRSCFGSCLGTPRQGLLAPATRAHIVFERRSISPDTLVGLSAFSHVWIVFVFHQNTNSKNTRAHDGLRSDSHRFTFRAKIAPPMLKERVGVFSTRSPHRPNPMGITLATIERVDMAARTVFVSGIDLVDGTPVLDIKPYVPAYDCLADAHAAAWVTPADQRPTIVQWETPALTEIVRVLAQTSQHYQDAPELLVRAIEQVLQVDVRSKNQTKRWADPTVVSRLRVDNASVEYSVMLPERTCLTGEHAAVRVVIRAVTDVATAAASATVLAGEMP